jgi:condensin complex subunit 2
MDEDGHEPDGGTDPAEAREFSSVVAGLRTSYPKDKMEEISTSFCFICLLHLANERGLKLEASDANGDVALDFDQIKGEQSNLPGDKVGEIWGLKVSLSRWYVMHVLIPPTHN